VSKATGRRWLVFADDFGDPGPKGQPQFGYALLGVERRCLPGLLERTADVRRVYSAFGEVKGKPSSRVVAAFLGAISNAAISHSVRTSVVVIDKERYTGPYLRDLPNIPRDSNFLRHYVVRHGLELMFDDETPAGTDELELVMDRVGLNVHQLANLEKYLSSGFAEEAFRFPKPAHVVQASSTYVEGLQLAHHLSTVVGGLLRNRLPDDMETELGRLVQMKTLLGNSREVLLHPAALETMASRYVVREKAEGPDSPVGHQPLI
jgi:hypothetical protein